jgi:hypothetical protein
VLKKKKLNLETGREFEFDDYGTLLSSNFAALVALFYLF